MGAAEGGDVEGVGVATVNRHMTAEALAAAMNLPGPITLRFLEAYRRLARSSTSASVSR